MSLFEFIVGMISVILALAVAQLFVGIAELMQRRDQVRFYLPHTLWLISLFLVTFLHWWSLWTFKDLPWNFGMFFFSLLGPSLMFFAATVINPRYRTKDDIDLEAHFQDIRQMFFVVIIAMLLLFTLDGPLFGTEPPINGIRGGQAIILLGCIAGLIFARKAIQVLASLMMLGGTSIIVIIRFLPGQG